MDHAAPSTRSSVSPALAPARGPVHVAPTPPAPSAPKKASPSDDSAMDALTSPAKHVDRFLSEYLQSLAIAPALRDAMAYSLLGPGKRVRPLLAWHCAAAVGGQGSASLPAGGAVELVHAFSLVHDDLPAMDDDDLRRGRPTLHRHTTEAMAILAGDEMLNLAYRLLVDRVESPALLGALVRELAVGTSGMISGQVYDSLGGVGGMVGASSDLERLKTIHAHKTGALIRAACRMGAMCGLMSADGSAPFPASAAATLERITTYADATGLIFQIVDDLLDVTQTAEHLGKKTGKDAEAGKMTYPGVLGVEASRAEVHRLLEVSLRAVETLGPAAEPLRQIATSMAVRTR